MSHASSLPPLSVERLSRRLAAIPGVFLEEPTPGLAPLATEAILHDVVLVQSGSSPGGDLFAEFGRSANRAATDAVALTQRQLLARLLAWLLMDDAFRGTAAERLAFALKAPMDVLSIVAARQFVEDTDRREELVRLTLRNLNLAPEGEPTADAEDRLSALDSVRRVRLLQEARAAEGARRQREQELAAELARKQAAEQAARYDREY